jgi:purine-binding chemotaxis protein CheW
MTREARDEVAAFPRDAKGGAICVLEFALDGLRYALPLSAVLRVVRAVEVTPLPKAPGIVLGVVNITGEIMPVIDLRSRFRLPAREMSCDDRLIVARSSGRTVVLAAESVSGVREIAAEAVAMGETLIPSAEYLHGVAALDDGLVVISDLERFLSLDEEERLDAALSGDEE